MPRVGDGTPGPGRPKGSRNKLGEAFLTALYDDFEAHGVAAIERVRVEKPDQYFKVIASILPKDINLNVNPIGEMTDDELIERIREIDKSIELDTINGNGERQGPHKLAGC